MEKEYFIFLVEGENDEDDKHIITHEFYDKSMEDDYRYSKDYNGYLVDFGHIDYALRWLNKHIPERFISEEFISENPGES